MFQRYFFRDFEKSIIIEKKVLIERDIILNSKGKLFMTFKKTVTLI